MAMMHRKMACRTERQGGGTLCRIRDGSRLQCVLAFHPVAMMDGRCRVCVAPFTPSPTSGECCHPCLEATSLLPGCRVDGFEVHMPILLGSYCLAFQGFWRKHV